MVVSWLVHSVSPKIRYNILWMEDVQAIWNNIKSRFFQVDLLCILELQKEAASLKQRTHNVSEFYTKLCIIRDKLENFCPKPICTCKVKSSCKMLFTILQRKHEDHVLQFLRGLNEQFDNIQSRVLLMDAINNNFLNNLKSKNVVTINTATCFFWQNWLYWHYICFKKRDFSAKSSPNKNFFSHCNNKSHKQIHNILLES